MKKYINVRLKGQKELVQIFVDQGIIREIAEQIPIECETIDLEGNLTIPPYVDPHIHLDYVFTANLG